MEGKYSYTLLEKVDGNTIPRGVNRKTKAYIKKLHRNNVSLNDLSNAILQALERNIIKGNFIIRENKKVILKVGN